MESIPLIGFWKELHYYVAHIVFFLYFPPVYKLVVNTGLLLAATVVWVSGWGIPNSAAAAAMKFKSAHM